MISLYLTTYFLPFMLYMPLGRASKWQETYSMAVVNDKMGEQLT